MDREPRGNWISSAKGKLKKQAKAVDSQRPLIPFHTYNIKRTLHFQRAEFSCNLCVCLYITKGRLSLITTWLISCIPHAFVGQWTWMLLLGRGLGNRELLPGPVSAIFKAKAMDFYGFLYLDDDNVTGDESCQSIPKTFEKLKTWLWMKHQHPFVWRPSCCLPVKWLDRSLEHLGAIIRAPIKKWLNCQRKHKLCLHDECVQAALSVASVAAALATVAASTAACSMDEKESRIGTAVASAAALVATHCADFAEQTGADYHAVLASVSSGGSVNYATDISELTTSAAASLQKVRHASTFQKEARVHSAIPPPLSPCFNVRSGYGTHAECYYNHEILARGGFFLVRFTAGKLHWRFISVFLDEDKQVILKLRSRHLAGAFFKTEKRVVFQILVSVRAWPGRSFLNNGIERHYFGLATPQGTIEFECATDFDHQSWTEGISHLLCVAKQ